MSNFESPIPLSEIESVLAWVDTFKLSRPTKKLNRDFSDAVLLAEILNVHYPKLVEMHNYPPRNSHSLKLNNWLTLNRKVLKKLKLNLCINTMEQLANCNNGVIERVLIMVREKIKRDEELNKSMKDAEQNMSSGGSFYEACGEDDNILVVPTKIRVNGVLETIQQKVVNYESYLSLKEELKDARDSCELLKQKVEHLDNLLILKEERIEELQKQLERKQARRKEAEAYQNSLQVPFETVPSPAPPVPPVPQGLSLEELIAPVCNTVVTQLSKTLPTKITEANKLPKEESKIPIRPDSTIAIKPIATKHSDVSGKDLTNGLIENAINLGTSKFSYTKLSGKTSNESVGNNLITYIDVNDDKGKENPLPGATNDNNDEDIFADVDRIKSDVFKEVEIVDDKVPPDFDEFEDSEQGTITTIEQTIQKEITDIVIPLNLMQNC